MQFPTQSCLKAIIVSVGIMLDKGINIIAFLHQTISKLSLKELILDMIIKPNTEIQIHLFYTMINERHWF